MNWLRRYLDRRAEGLYLNALVPVGEITKVVRDPTLGRNVVATESIPAGSLLGIYPGIKLSISEYKKKHSFIEKAVSSSYQLSEDRIVDPTDVFGYLVDIPDNRIALINEATKKNQLNIVSLISSSNVWYFTIAQIPKDQPLYSFYGYSYRRDYLTEHSDGDSLFKFSESEIELLKDAAERFRWLQEDIKLILENGDV